MAVRGLRLQGQGVPSAAVLFWAALQPLPRLRYRTPAASGRRPPQRCALVRPPGQRSVCVVHMAERASTASVWEGVHWAWSPQRCRRLAAAAYAGWAQAVLDRSDVAQKEICDAHPLVLRCQAAAGVVQKRLQRAEVIQGAQCALRSSSDTLPRVGGAGTDASHRPRAAGPAAGRVCAPCAWALRTPVQRALKPELACSAAHTLLRPQTRVHRVRAGGGARAHCRREPQLESGRARCPPSARSERIGAPPHACRLARIAQAAVRRQAPGVRLCGHP